MLIDSHGAPVDQAVWALYQQVLECVGPVATLIERDNQLPVFSELLAQAELADCYLLTTRERT